MSVVIYKKQDGKILKALVEPEHLAASLKAGWQLDKPSRKGGQRQEAPKPDVEMQTKEAAIRRGVRLNPSDVRLVAKHAGIDEWDKLDIAVLTDKIRAAL